jgi:hypothetical protein
MLLARKRFGENPPNPCARGTAAPRAAAHSSGFSHLVRESEVANEELYSLAHAHSHSPVTGEHTTRFRRRAMKLGGFCGAVLGAGLPIPPRFNILPFQIFVVTERGVGHNLAELGCSVPVVHLAVADCGS